MKTLPNEQEALIKSEVQEAVDYINAMYERLLLNEASEAEENLITAIAAEGLQHGRGAALSQALDLFQKLKVN